MGILDSFFSNREIKRLEKKVAIVNSFEPKIKALSDAELVAKTSEFKKRLQNGETVDDILPEAFSVCREASSRVLGMRHYDVQMMGGIVLNEGRIAEMKTGEGKTLVATAPVYLNALTGKGVHVITVNDYLAKRDMEWMSKLYNFLDLSTGVIVHGLNNVQRRAAYNADITYGTNNEFGFDYLRDNMVIYKHEMVQRPLNYAIVDEVDSILVDEARTPLIISGQGDKSTSLYTQADTFIKTLHEEEDYIVNEKENASTLTEIGLQKAERFFGVESMTDIANMEIYHNIGQALRANTLMRLDVDYVVRDGEIVIVDEFTGRLMFGRRYSAGLHQAIEAKEGLKIQRESKTLATITFQNYFRMYQKLSGMTGTAKTEEEEFRSIYNMDVVQIPTNRPIVRQDLNDVVYKTEEAKFNAVVEEVARKHETGQPLLVGTISIENSEKLSEKLKRRGIKHEVLNAKNHEKEAEIVAQAGRFNSVTIATNMAGRGTDIILGGNPDFMANKEMRKLGYEDHVISFATGFAPSEDEELLAARETYQRILKEKKEELREEQEKVAEVGGLGIIGTERHESRRIDNQLRGRSGRQGDPGDTKFFISLEDDLMRKFGGEKMSELMDRFGIMDDDEPIEAKVLTKRIEGAQKKVEGINFGIRKSVLEYDDVMNVQREIIYKERRRVLEGENITDEIQNMIRATVDSIIMQYMPANEYEEEWDLHGLFAKLSVVCGIHLNPDAYSKENLDKDAFIDQITTLALKRYHEQESQIPEEQFRELERVILFQAVDRRWMDHIDAMDQLRQGIGLRALGQENPVRAYQMEGFDMFDAMNALIQEDTVRYVLNVTLTKKEEQEEQVQPAEEPTVIKVRPQDVIPQRKQVVDVTSAKEQTADSSQQTVKQTQKVGRNDECPCGSGKKYKKCCGKDV